MAEALGRERARRPLPAPDPEVAAYIAALPEHASLEARVAALLVLLEALPAEAPAG